MGAVSLWWLFVRWWRGCRGGGDDGNEDNHHRGCSRFHFPVTGSSITAPVITARRDGSWELLEVGSHPGCPRTSTLQSASVSLDAVLDAMGWLLDPFSPRSHGGWVPVPVPCIMGALRRLLPGRTPWVGVWQGPPARPWPRGPVQVRAGPALGAVPRRSRPGGGGTQWDQFSDWVSAGGATPPRWL